MPKKLKTKKSIAKRVKLTKTGKLIKKKAGQSHFNIKESGKIKRNKRRNVPMPKGVHSTIKKFI